MKLKFMRGYHKDKPKIEIGTLEYTGEEYIWKYAPIDESLGFADSFWDVPHIPRGLPEYRSKELFEYFKWRIPPKRRKDFGEYLEMFGLDEYTEWGYIVASGLRTVTDMDELVKEV